MIFLILFAQFVFSEPIVLYPTQSVASDLLHPKTQAPMTSEQALALKNTLDLSTLEPEKTSYYDGVKKIVKTETLNLSELHLTEIPSYQVLDLMQLIAENKQGEKFYVYFGPKSHNLILRNGLLKKLGYNVNPIQHVLNLNLKTQNANQANSLLQTLQRNLIFKNSNRWITNIQKKLVQDNWVWEYTKGSSSDIALQDVIVTPVNNKTFDLDYGLVTPEIIDGYRSLNALIVPYSLVEVPESINKFLPQPGQIYDQKVYLDYSLQNPDFDYFTAPLEDAQWMVRKLSKLTREDFYQVVDRVQYPAPELKKLLVEKLIARRNWLVQFFLKTENIAGLKTNLKFSHGLVKEGVITKETQYQSAEDVYDPDKWYVGYGSRFSFEQKEAPISWDQVQAYLWTLLSTNLQSNFVQQINKELPQTNLEKKSIQNVVDYQIDSFFNCILSNDCNPKTDYWNAPFFKFKLLNQRAVQFGSIFGTNNQIQLVEEFGVGLDAGVFFSSLGLDPSELLTANIEAGYLRKWTHIKPLASIKETLDSEYHYKIIPKFKSLIVPFTQYKLGHSLKDLENGSIAHLDQSMPLSEENSIERSEQQIAIDQLLENLFSDFSLGQSFIVTDQLSLGAGVQFGKKLSNNWELNASAGSKILDLARMHIYHASPETLHIYITKAALSESQLSTQLSLFIPILSSYWGYKNSADIKECFIPQTQEIQLLQASDYISTSISGCSPTTFFYELKTQSIKEFLNEQIKNNLSPKEIKTNTQAYADELLQNLKLISKALTDYSIAKTQRTLENFKLSQKVQHKFSESLRRISFLSKQWFKASTTDEIHIQTVTPAQELSPRAFNEDELLLRKKKLLIHKHAQRTGNNYQKLLTDIANWFIDDQINNSDINVSVPGNSNPADTIYGKATQRKLSLEALIEDAFIAEPIVKIQLNHKGWKLNFNQTIELINNLNKKFGDGFIDPKLFYGMQEYQLYQIQVEQVVFEKGLKYLIFKKPEFFKPLFKQANIKLYASEKKRALDKYLNLEEALEAKKHRAYIQFKRKSQNLYKAYTQKNINDFKHLSLEMVDYLDSLFDFKVFNQFFGEGENHENTYVYANLSGFKKGLENALEDVRSIHLGQVGQYPLSGPADMYRKEHLSNMSPGEFYLTWILEAY